MNKSHMISIRDAVTGDLQGITEIYNEAVLSTDATMDSEPKSEKEQEAWFSQHGGRYPVLMAEWGGKIAGWGSLSRWSERCGYADTTELSFYVKEEFRGKGIGKELFRALIERGKKLGHHSIISRITAGNEISIRLHEKFGFSHAGLLKEAGYKFGQWLDVAILQKIL